MAELKFACPHCGQHIECDELWGGHQIKCPVCQGELTVPTPAPMAPAPAAAPPPPPPARPPGPGAAPRPGAGMPPGRGPVTPRRPTAPAEKKSNVTKIVAVVVTVIVCGIGGYLGFGYLTGMQNSANEKRREVEKKSDGGEMGHIANLYDFLDATEPGGRGLGGKRGTGPSQRSIGAQSVHVAGEEDDFEPEKKLPLAPAVYSLDVNAAQLSGGRANGKIAGTNFVVDAAIVDTAGGSQVLRLMQGSPIAPVREVLIYIQLKAGGTVAGHSWQVATNTKTSEIVQVIKSWQPNPKYAPERKAFTTGYALKLDIGQAKNGEIPGKIFLSFPDKEQSVVAGAFTVRPYLRKYMHLSDEM